MNTLDVELDYDKLPWHAAKTDEVNAHFGDMLATIFAGQRQLMEKYLDIEGRNGCVVVPPDMEGQVDDRLVQIRLKDLTWRCVEELGEAMNCLKNKPWKQSFVATDKEHLVEELSDAFHFFVELCITAGLSADDLFQLYWLKHEVNKFRQRSNY